MNECTVFSKKVLIKNVPGVRRRHSFSMKKGFMKGPQGVCAFFGTFTPLQNASQTSKGAFIIEAVGSVSLALKSGNPSHHSLTKQSGQHSIRFGVKQKDAEHYSRYCFPKASCQGKEPSACDMAIEHCTPV